MHPHIAKAVGSDSSSGLPQSSGRPHACLYQSAWQHSHAFTSLAHIHSCCWIFGFDCLHGPYLPSSRSPGSYTVCVSPPDNRAMSHQRVVGRISSFRCLVLDTLSWPDTVYRTRRPFLVDAHVVKDLVGILDGDDSNQWNFPQAP